MGHQICYLKYDSGNLSFVHVAISFHSNEKKKEKLLENSRILSTLELKNNLTERDAFKYDLAFKDGLATHFFDLLLTFFREYGMIYYHILIVWLKTHCHFVLKGRFP